MSWPRRADVVQSDSAKGTLGEIPSIHVCLLDAYRWRLRLRSAQEAFTHANNKNLKILHFVILPEFVSVTFKGALGVAEIPVCAQPHFHAGSHFSPSTSLPCTRSRKGVECLGVKQDTYRWQLHCLKNLGSSLISSPLFFHSMLRPTLSLPASAGYISLCHCQKTHGSRQQPGQSHALRHRQQTHAQIIHARLHTEVTIHFTNSRHSWQYIS